MDKDHFQIRLQEIGDAQRLFEILSNPNFNFFQLKIPSVEAEIEFIKNSYANFGKSCYNFVIVYDNIVVGAIGVHYNSNGIGEIGYFVDEQYWSCGFATEALKLIEQKCFKDFSLTRLILLIEVGNIGSERVAIKSGYEKEGVARKSNYRDGEMRDMMVYAKIKNEPQ